MVSAHGPLLRPSLFGVSSRFTGNSNYSPGHGCTFAGHLRSPVTALILTLYCCSTAVSSDEESSSSDEDMDFADCAPQSSVVVNSPRRSPCPPPDLPCPGPRPLITPVTSKRKRESRNMFTYNSPLNRERTVSPTNNEKRTCRSDAAISRGPHRSPQRRQSKRRWTRRSGVDRLRVPEERRRRGTRDPFLALLVPPPAAPKPIQLPPQPEVHQERFPDPLVTKMVERAAVNQSLQNKSVSAARLEIKFSALEAFLRRSSNREWWVSTRKETIANAGLNVLCPMLDETLTWAKMCVRNNIDVDDATADIIFCTAAFLASHIVFKIKQLLPCMAGEAHQQATARQLCYLICSGPRFSEVGDLLNGLVIDHEINLMISLACVVPLLTRQYCENARTVPLMNQYLQMYRPGMATAIMEKHLRRHTSQCQSRACASTVRAIVGAPTQTRGLFFVPVTNV